MIWLLFALMAAGTLLYLWPSLFAKTEAEDDAELTAYFAQIDAIKADDNMPESEAEAAIAGLERQVLERRTLTSGSGSRLSGLAILLGIGLIGLTVYLTQGNPQYATADLDRSPDPRILQTQQVAQQREMERLAQLEDLVGQLRERLQTDRAEDPMGWRIYARTLMNMGRFDEGLAAYDRLVELSDDPEVRDERQTAIDYVADQSRIGQGQPPRPTAEDIRNAQTLSEDDRAAMIQGMVEGLAARLEAEPNNPEGWAQLIRARLVLGQTELAKMDIVSLRSAYPENEALVEGILRSAGYSE